MKLRLWKKILLGCGLVFTALLVLSIRPIVHLTKVALNDWNELTSIPHGKINDASRLNETAETIWLTPPDSSAAEQQLIALLQRARTNHLKVSVAGARHSMGGHVIYPGGIAVDMLPFSRMELDLANRILHVQAGARWRDVILLLNSHGLSVEVMQSNDDFSVGGSISVNCHGWQFNRSPIASTVDSLRIMLADGRILKCSRSENAELFSLVLGGYGLFGIILDVDLSVVPNERYTLKTIPTASSNYVATLTDNTNGRDDAAMVYGRLNLTRTHFLQDALLNIYRRKTSPTTNGIVSTLARPKNIELKRALFRGGITNDYGKKLRWTAERIVSAQLLPLIIGHDEDRNDILTESSAWFLEHGTNRTDILIECFVPPDQFEPFLAELRKIIPTHQADLLNLTIRHVNQDTNSFLRYADRDMVALVMLFSQTRDASGELDMAKVTQEIIDAALNCDGRHYLPYRLHATPKQFQAAYPQAKKFFELKRKYDPDELFQNEFYLKYARSE